MIGLANYLRSCSAVNKNQNTRTCNIVLNQVLRVQLINKSHVVVAAGADIDLVFSECRNVSRETLLRKDSVWSDS